MSWSFNYLTKLQKEIEKYRDQMMNVINFQPEKGHQDELLKLSRKLDKLILGYQNYSRILDLYQTEPYTADFYMNTNLQEAVLPLGNRDEINGDVIVVKNNIEDIMGLLETKILTEDNAFIDKISNNFAICESGSSIWVANTILNDTNSDFIIVAGLNGDLKGFLKKEDLKILCAQKPLNIKLRNNLSIMKEFFDHVPVSMFILDEEFFINYANTEAVKNFNEILPGNYLFKKADLVFSSLFNKNYREFVKSEFWDCISNLKSCSGVEISLLSYISLTANIKVIENIFGRKNIIISFLNVDELKQKVEELTMTSDELIQALSLFIPYHVEKELRTIPEYRDIYNKETGMITIVSKIKDGGYWHVINCLKILSQIDRTGIFEKYRIDKNLLVQAIIVHDIGKKQPDLEISDTVDAKGVFESGKLHAKRSAMYCKQNGYKKEVVDLVKYHHHEERELPKNWPQRLVQSFRMFKIIDGLSAAVTRRNATISVKLSGDYLLINESNKERPEYSRTYNLNFVRRRIYK